jgi:predicted Zn-dependent protease
VPAEEEADLFAAQYLWAAGYDPHALVTFFEKLQAKEKKKPGTMSKIFSTHPVVGDRIERVNALISRFPDRSEYTISTSEFETVKKRLVAQTNARSTTARAGGAADKDAQRPSLKKRQPPAPGGTDPNATGAPTSTDGKAEPAADRPTLKKKGESSSSPKTDPQE